MTTAATPAERTSENTSQLERLCSGICCLAGLLLAAAASLAVDAERPLARTALGALTIPAAWFLYASCLGSRQLQVSITKFVMSCVVAVGLSELALRTLTIYPLQASSNVILAGAPGFRPDPALPETDNRGFRNPELPTRAQIVAIGDSHTRGFNVTSAESWPMQLGRMLNCTVYNFGMCGSGPLHYAQLAEQALAMQPQLLIVAVYPPDDLRDVAKGIHAGSAGSLQFNNVGRMTRDRLAIDSLGRQMLRRAGLDSADSLQIHHSRNPTLIGSEAATGAAVAMDTKDPRIASALNQTIAVLQSVNAACEAKGCGFMVLIIPSRARVYQRYLESESQRIPPPIDAMLANERRVVDTLTQSLHVRGIAFTDACENLVRQLDRSAGVYPPWNDGHPLAAGYRAYADAVKVHVASRLQNRRIAAN
jgi:hypothetical protein